MHLLIRIILEACIVAATLFAACKCIQMLQLESYQGNMYRKWIVRAGIKDCTMFLAIGCLAIALQVGVALWIQNNWVSYVCQLAIACLLVYLAIRQRKQPQKKPLVFTGRVKRLMVVFALLVAMFRIVSIVVPISGMGGTIAMQVVGYVPILLLPIFVLLAHFLTYPIESSIKRWYFNDAKHKLEARPDLIKIGITGSYGKTSTKFILGTILQEQYSTLVTPSSFNTPMGVTRVVREQLQPEHEVFVAEMGARYRGDIKELCQLVNPKYGLITSVGKQHLETFGSYEAVIATKGELLDALPNNGAAFLNGDNPDCRKMYEACTLEHKYLFGIEGTDLYLRATDIQVDGLGSRFTLVNRSGEHISCKTILLGRHNILNITGAAALAHYLGLTLEQIAAGIEQLKPVKHRLELIPGPITVIDDAFNANPAGTKAALEVLRGFSGRRIIVTPGMIELGEEEAAFNEAFGRDIAGAADIAILVGKAHVDPIEKGLLGAGFDAQCIVRVESLAKATEKLPLYTVPGCVVLLENDLPDNYNE